MLVTVLELAATWAEPVRVLDEVEARLAAGPATDLVVLPEASIHGYVSPERDFDLARFAEPIDGPTARRLAAIATLRRVHVVAPLVLREAGAIYNAMACFDPRGELAFVYRKRHPWLPETWATPGPLPPPVIELHGRTITLAICYDLHSSPTMPRPSSRRPIYCCSPARGSNDRTLARRGSRAWRGNSSCTS